MAERLPFGEIRPGARPIGAFVNPGSVQVAAAARPESMPGVSGFNAIQQGSQGNVQGYNQFAQIAEALAPFSKQLMQLAETGIMSYAKGKIDEGYYDELKNIQQRSTLSWQMQQEQGAANAAGAITKLERVDPPAAQLLKETNPWALVGRRRALAQQAGTEVDNMLAADLQLNQGELSVLQPGSGALMQRKSGLAQAVLSRYGLTGDEPEAAYYMTPKLNEAWDKYTDKQQKLYNETLTINTQAQVTSALGGVLQGMAQNGIPLADGSVVPMGDPRFAELAGTVMTQHLDKSLTMFGGQAKADALKDIRTQLLGTFGQDPVMGAALSFIQGGNPGDAVRPTWGASYGLEILETRNRGNAARQQSYELGQKGIEQGLDGLWWQEGSPGSMLPTDPGYASALMNFRNKAAAAGYRDIDGYMKGRMDSQESVVGRAYAPDPLASEDFMAQIQDLPRSALNTPQAVAALREQARTAARAEPTPELQAAKYKEYLDAITAKQKQAAETTPGLQSAIDKALLQDLGLPQVKPLVDAAKSKSGGGDAFAQALAGAGAMAAASGLGNEKIAAFTQRLNNLFLRNAEAKIDQWMAERPGVPLSSSARNVLISEAIAETRKSEEYKQAFQALTGKNPGEVGQGKVGTGPSQGTAPGPAARGVGRTAAAALPDTTVKGFAVRPVMDGNWIYGELQAVSKGKPVSADLYRLANRAGTTTNRYLLEQLRFYPQLDPNGEATKYLEQQIRTQRQGQTVSSANWQGVAGQVIGTLLGERPAAAGTMPTPAAGGGFQYSGQAPAQAQPAARQVAPAAPVLPSAPRPMAIPQARVGSMPAPGNGTGLYNPLAPGSWLMSMIMPARPAMSLPAVGGFDGDGGGWDDGPAIASSHTDSGNGFTIPGARDASGRPPIFSRGGANAFAAMVRDSGGVVKASDIASSQRSSGKNAAVGGANGSEHLKGNAMDIHGASEAWIRKHGAKYGWYVHDYDGTHGGHFEFRGGGTAAPRRGGGGNQAGYMKRLAYLETRIRNIPNAEGSPGRGYFQAFPAFSSEAIAASGGIDPRDPDYNRSAKASWAWIEKHNPRAAAAVKAGRYDEADRLLRNTWPSLPGGSQAQPDQVQREARRYLGGR
jgi:hypothetical protein